MINPGTLTRNEQTVTELYTVDELVFVDPAAPAPPAHVSPALHKTLEVGALCNDASIVRNEDGNYVGQATDVALLNVLSVFGLPDPRQVSSLCSLLVTTSPTLLHQTFKRIFERPFNSETKSMAISGTYMTSNANVSHLNGSGRELYHIKGSIDVLLPRCKFYHVAEGSTPVLDQKMRSGIASKAQAASTRGLRVLAMAYGNADAIGPSRPSSPMPSNPTDYNDKDKSTHLVFAGFVAMYDPPRKGVADAVAHLQRGGVQVIMITGDGDETALSIAKSLGLRGASNPNACLTGSALDRMTAGQLSERVGSVSVFARVSPKHKMAIVEAFQARGAVVAMTGDGGKFFFFLNSLSISVLIAHGCCESVAVNDAPALKMADIGVSMGKTGTDVAKEAADVILVDDNFSTILPAVEEGELSSQNTIIDL